MSWNQGSAQVDDLLNRGKVERVPPSLDGARGLVRQARNHLESVGRIVDLDVELAYDGLHSANRKALTAVLLAQGLRPTRDGGHTAVYEAVRAQLDPPLGSILAPYGRIRRQRNDGDYLQERPATSDDVRQDLPLCTAIVDAVEKVLGQMPTY